MERAIVPSQGDKEDAVRGQDGDGASGSRSSRRRRIAIAVLSVGLMGGAFPWLVSIPHAQGPTLMFVIPIAALALEFGLRGGIAGMLIGSTLATIYLIPHTAEVGVQGYASRYVAFLCVGGLVGAVVDRLRAAQVSLERRVDERTAELRRSEARFRALLDATPITILGLELDGTVSWSNAEARVLLGREHEGLLGTSLERLFAPRSRQLVAATLEDALSTARAGVDGRHVLVHEVSEGLAVVRGDGTELPVDLALNPMANDGAPRLVCALRDVSQRVRAQQEQDRLQTRIRQSERMESIGQLAGGIAHDFNNVLAVILNYAEFVEERVAHDPEVRQDVAEIRTAAERAAALTRQLLLFSRREVRADAIVDVNELVGEIEKLMRRTLGEHIDLRLALSPATWPVRLEASQLEQVLLNLAINARDAMPAGGTLTIETANIELDEAYLREHAGVEAGRHVRIVVTDTGAGMAPEVAARVFEPFFTTKPRGEGTGLGLATAYGIVSQAGGHMEVYSEPGHGTVFKVYLPAAESEAPARPAPAHGRGETLDGRVLVVEDEEPVRAAICRILGDTGFDVIAATSPAEALALLADEGGTAIDLLVTDVIMPGMPGPELAGRLKERLPELAVLFVSGYTDDYVARHGVLDGEEVLLEKPFNRTQLLAAVRRAMGVEPQAPSEEVAQ